VRIGGDTPFARLVHHIPPDLGSCIMELGILRDPSEPGRGNKLRPRRREDVKT